MTKKHLIFSTIRNVINKGLSPVSSLFDYHKLETKIPINCRRRVILKRMFRDYFFSHIEFNLFINFPFGTTQYSRNVEPFCNSEDFKSNYGLAKTLPHFPTVNEWVSLGLNHPHESLPSVGREELPRRWLRNLGRSLVLVGSIFT